MRGNWDKKSHYIQENWLEKQLDSMKENVFAMPLVDPKDVLSPLHIKLSLMKNFVKGTNHKGKPFKYYLKDKFYRLRAAKVKEGDFVGQQIRQLQKNPAFDQVLKGN